MATRTAFRHVSRRFSSGGKILSEEEKAAENVYIKKIEQEKLEKLARKGPQVEAAAAETKAGDSTGAKESTTEKTSTDKYRNYAVLAGAITIVSGLGWYMKAGSEKKAAKE